MKKQIISFFLALFCCVNVSMACTTFFLEKNGQMVFGRNYDWVTATAMVNTNQRGLKKSSLPLEKGSILQWTSKYGSVTFNQYGKEFPNGGMNEKGLVVELMWLSDSRFPAPDSRPAFSVLQWIQYQLDNCSTVDEVIATDKKIRIANTGTPQHYLVADKNGRVATIEFLNGRMVVHTGANLPYPVLANSTYDESYRAVKAASSNRSKPAASFNDNSIERFATACNMVERYRTTNIKKPLVDYSFDILNKVSQGGFTKWSIVYDISNSTSFFKTSEAPQLKSFALNAFNFSCSVTPLAFDMNESIGGSISKRFSAYNNGTNKQRLKQAFIQSRSQVNIPIELQDAMADVAASFTCK